MKIFLRPIQDQVVVLVGATSGIGLETALMMAEKGARVVIVGRSQEGLREAFERTQARAETVRITRLVGANSGYGNFADVEAGGAPSAGMTASSGIGDSDMMTDSVMALEGDITSFEDMRRVAEHVVQHYGRIDTWVNVAAVSEWALFEDTSPDEFRRIIDVNLVGHAYAAMAALPFLRQQQASALIFVSSISGRLPVPYQSAYNASKHGLLGMIDTMRLELEHTGTPVSVTSIMPASINTPLFEKARTKLGVEPDPIPPIYDATMVARAILFAAEHPVRELIVGDAGHMMVFMRRMAPNLTTRMLGAIGFRKQRSNEPKSAQAPDNLYNHISGYNEGEGEYTHQEMKIAPLTYLSTHPKTRMAIMGGALALLGLFVGWRVVKARRAQRGWRYRLPREAKQVMKLASAKASLASKSTGKQFRRAGKTISHLPMVQRLPMFHKPTFREKVMHFLSDAVDGLGERFSGAGDALTGVWAALIAMAPFQRKQSLGRRLSDGMPDVRLPEVRLSLKREKTLAERMALAEQRKMLAHGVGKAGDRLGKASGRVRERIGDTSKLVRERVGETGGAVRERVIDAGGRVRERFVARGKDDVRIETVDTTKEVTVVKPHVRKHTTIVEEVRVKK